jgi:hypothetical protein
VSGLDLDGAVPARRAGELLDGPAGVVLDEPGDGEGGEYDGQAGDDPGQHQVEEDLVPARGVLQAQDPVGPLDGIDQVAYPGRSDRRGLPGAGLSRPRSSSA